MNKLYIGVDVGKSGSICCLTEDNKLTYHVIPIIPKTNEISITGIRDILDLYIREGTEVISGMENVASIYGASAKANFQFGRCLGIIEGVLSAKSIPFIKIQPKTWQAYSCAGVPDIRKPDTVNKKGEKVKGAVDTKARALVAAFRLFPNETFLATTRSRVPHDGIVDGTLIAYYLKNHR